MTEPPKQSQGFWKRLKPVIVGLVIGGSIGIAGTGAALWVGGNLRDPQVSANSVVVRQTNQPERQWLVEPGMVGVFMAILFSVWGIGFATLISLGGIGFSFLNRNNRELKDELKQDHKILSDKVETLNSNIDDVKAEFKQDHEILGKTLSNKIDELIKSQKPTPITTSQS